jgi:hypothetical protein
MSEMTPCTSKQMSMTLSSYHFDLTCKESCLILSLSEHTWPWPSPSGALEDLLLLTTPRLHIPEQPVHVFPDLVDERNGDGLLVGVERDVRRSRRGEWGGIAGLDEGRSWCWCA